MHQQPLQILVIKLAQVLNPGYGAVIPGNVVFQFLRCHR